jgi:hypothetical protein
MKKTEEIKKSSTKNNHELDSLCEVRAVTVVQSYDNVPQEATSWLDNAAGNKAAEKMFSEILMNEFNVPESDVHFNLEAGFFDNNTNQVYLIHS